MRSASLVVLTVLVYGCATSSNQVFEQQSSSAAESAGELRLEIHSPSQGQRLTSGETSYVVEGGASNFGGVRYLDLIFVLDSSKSLLRSDPKGYLSAGTAGLVRSLSPQSDIHIGLVSFDTEGRLLMPLTQDRAFVVEALGGLPRAGGTDVATGIRAALEEFEKNARPDSSRVILLFTDGQSSARKAGWQPKMGLHRSAPSQRLPFPQ